MTFVTLERVKSSNGLGITIRLHLRFDCTVALQGAQWDVRVTACKNMEVSGFKKGLPGTLATTQYCIAFDLQ